MSEQVIQGRFRGFMSLAAHPDGCAANVASQIAYLREHCPGAGLGNALVIGSSTGYGFGSLLNACFGYGAACLGICFEKPSDGRRTATAGWYNLAAAHQQAKQAGRHLETINADAFAHETREQAIAALKERFGKLDLVVYSLASPRRKDPDSDTVWQSALKPIGEPYSGKTVDLRSEEVTEVSIEAASEEEITGTQKVMGGEDWALWMQALRDADLLSDGCRSVAYSYIGPELTYPIYRSGCIGKAKEHLEATAKQIDADLSASGGNAWVSVNKALVTQASAAIPVLPLYISLLYRVMKERGTHEGCIEQMTRLFTEHLGPGQSPSLDEAGRIRLDDRELEPSVQSAVDELWQQVSTENLREISDFAGFQRGFRQLFGFEVDGVDYEAPTEIERELAETAPAG